MTSQSDETVFTAGLIPREVLFGNPTKTSPKISPDGKMLAYLAPVANVLNVWIKTIGANDDRSVTKDTVRGIRHYFWTSDNRRIMYLQDVGGNENWRLYQTDIATGETRDLTPFDGVQARVIYKDKHFPTALLIGMNKDDPKVHDVYRLDLETGELRMVAKNPGNIAYWVVDRDFRVRCAGMSRPEGGYDLMFRESEEGKWRKLLTWELEDSAGSGPVGFSKDGSHIYLQDSRDVDTSRLTRFDISTGKTEVIAGDPEYDVGGVVVNPDTYEIQAVSFTRDRREWEVLDESVKQDFEAIAGLERGDFAVCDRDDADRNWLLSFSADNGAVAYYSFDRESKKGTFLFHHMPELNDYSLCEMKPVSFKSRDGLTIHGYITLPAVNRKTALPMVLYVHGGPWGRNTWGYEPTAQWLANRGYVSLQVNFRGSTGYGKSFVNAGNREWAGKMHDDLVDAVNWAIGQGIADPSRVAIFGGSYGGYAALVGATFTPDVFCCAVDIVGPSNLATLINSVPPYWSTFLAELHQRVGNPETDAEFLMSRSPLSRVDRIRAPILIGQGANDPRVKQAESEQIVEAMKSKGLEYEYILFPDEGHGFARPENRLTFYAAAERFLAKHLGGRYQESPA